MRSDSRYKMRVRILEVGGVVVEDFYFFEFSSLTTALCPFPAAHDSGVRP
jgi:hypothetical protein